MPPFIEAVIERVRAWFYPLPVSDGPDPFVPIPREVPVLQPLPAATAHELKTPVKPPKDAGASGEFYFRETILDQLDFYFTCLRRMRFRDPGAYDLYRQIGAQLVPYSVIYTSWCEDHLTLSPWWRQHRPSFGAIGYCVDPKSLKVEELKKDGKKVMLPKFLYFSKFEPERAPWDMQRIGLDDGVVYSLTVYWDMPLLPHWKKGGVPTEYGVHVTKDGELKLLRMLCNERKRVHSKRGHDWFSIPQQRWGIDRFFLDWAAEHKQDPAKFLLSLFVEATEIFESAQHGMVRVDVGKDELHAAFGINVKRTPYFFKDREVMESGKKRIFHIVRPHMRKGSGGQERAVRMHFRGEQDFNWNGYRVRITVPGLHHQMLSEVSFGLADWSMIKPEETRTWREMGFLGARIRKHLDKTMRRAS